ncbi:hypothetical protein J6590_012177 [Homalodisca vitripennis]|nr:hypothetical protein J6590_012177 [Homalodisca vitripennis]
MGLSKTLTSYCWNIDFIPVMSHLTAQIQALHTLSPAAVPIHQPGAYIRGGSWGSRYRPARVSGASRTRTYSLDMSESEVGGNAGLAGVFSSPTEGHS